MKNESTPPQEVDQQPVDKPQVLLGFDTRNQVLLCKRRRYEKDAGAVPI